METLTPHQSAKMQCQQCLGMDQFNRNEVQDCGGDICHAGPCPIFHYRLGKRTPVKVFRVFCLQCMGGCVDFVRECETVTCPAHPYRMGKNPARAGMGNPKALLRTRAETVFLTRETTICP
ncbi:MAG: hypothetical protein C4576_09175 [Desulfobacteraceae bacterium]|nr:MAG: hypothetical protein C4576_09175 [Desulfobacteraceae bacterium]